MPLMLPPQIPQIKPPAKAFGFKEIAVRVLLVGFVLFGSLAFGSSFSQEEEGRKVAVPEYRQSPRVFPGFLTRKPVFLASEDDETWDVLLLGTNGAHTDSIMIVSINVVKEKISIFSLPRDLYVNQSRINQYYTYEGLDVLFESLHKATGLTIDRYVQIDFAGFVDIVDLLGGVDVTVEKDIYDSTYPDGRGGYAPFSILAGYHHLSGEEALKYARSRHMTSDFDRARRQQQIIDSLKVQAQVFYEGMSLREFSHLIDTILVVVKTDIRPLEAVNYYLDYKDFTLQTGLVFSTSDYLVSSINENGAYMLEPRNGNFAAMHQAIADWVN